MVEDGHFLKTREGKIEINRTTHKLHRMSYLKLHHNYRMTIRQKCQLRNYIKIFKFQGRGSTTGNEKRKCRLILRSFSTDMRYSGEVMEGQVRSWVNVKRKVEVVRCL